jgi:hypothetical protein
VEVWDRGDAAEIAVFGEKESSFCSFTSRQTNEKFEDSIADERR